MRLKSARLHGLIGVYSASGKKEIFIDFTKCTSNIILIIGENGAGKTTIWEALQPIPLHPSKFIEKEPGFIELEYIYDDILYAIRIEYPITNSRDRAQTKAFLNKITSNGDIIELNPNGNIGSYKSALYSEFNLDPNFISLSQLSSEDMGIVSKKPSERKKFVASIVESIEVYNQIYKALSKRSTIFKSMINSITAKIDTIGNQENLLTQLNALSNRLQRLNAEKDRLVKELAKSESVIQLTDPNGEIQNLYKSVSDDLYSIHQQMNGYDIYIKNISNSFGTTSLDDLTKLYKDITDNIYELKSEINKDTESIQTLLASKEEEGRYIKIKTEKINSLKSEFNFDYIKERLKTVRKNISDCEIIFSRLNLPKDNEITKDEFIYGINIMTEIKDSIFTIKSFSDEVILNKVIKNLKDGKSISTEFYSNNEILQKLYEQKNEYSRQLDKYTSLLEYTSDLDKRPSDCKIDNCPFIKTALECFNQKPKENISYYNEKLSEIEDIIKNQEKICNELSDSVDIERMLTAIINRIKQSTAILNKFPTGKYLTDIDIFLDNFGNVMLLNNLTDLSDSLQYANTFEQYKHFKSELIKLESEYKIYQNKQSVIDELSNEISDLSKKLSILVYDIQDKQDIILQKKKEKIELEDKLKKLDNSIRIIREKTELQKKEEILLTKLSTITNNIEVIKAEIEKQNIINSNISNINKDIEPTSSEKDKISYSLNQLEEYNEELAVYNEKYSLVEIIRKYSSPTKGGIQTLFMQLYMGKTISMANELLALLFNGKFELLPYIINESEFRIPCINKESNVQHDDISSCSSGERSMISMMISFSLLHHSSTVYNILRLDEIDGALDQNNRSKFLIVLDRFMKELGVENCIMISHSSEMDMSNVDIIQLTPVDNNQPNGNIIFTYND